MDEVTTKEYLKSMMERYNIGAKPLSRLLGWGETTAMRYLGGDVKPNKEFAAKIKLLSENPWEYVRVLEDNKEQLTDVAYRKSKKAVQQELFCDRSIEAMQYIVELAEGDIAPYRIMIVLYYAQVCSVVFRGLPLFKEDADFSAGQKVVYPGQYEVLRKYGVQRMMPEAASFSKDEQEYLTAVYQLFNSLSPNALKALYVREKRRIRRHLKSGADKLSPDDVRGQYETVFKKIGVNTVEELKLYLSYMLRKEEA